MTHATRPPAEIAPVAIRRATPADEPAIAQLLKESGLHADVAWRETTVATREGRVVACARLRPLADETHELAGVAVAPAERGAGIGVRIVGATLANAPGTVYALALAPAFFHRLGFKLLNTTPDVLSVKATTTCATTDYAPLRWNREEGGEP